MDICADKLLGLSRQGKMIPYTLTRMVGDVTNVPQ